VPEGSAGALRRGVLRAVAFLALACAGHLGCAGVAEMLGAALAYEEAPLPQGRALLDLPYRSDPGAEPRKHALDVFLPESPPAAAARPVFVFVHGGGWTRGDRAMGGLGIEPIRNLGRFFAARGFVVVTPSYRLQPEVGWREQVADVAAALAWVRREIGRYGGDPDAVHLGGHSAGAWLAAWVGLDDAALAAYGQGRDFLCSLVLVSGAGYDMQDAQTYALGASRDFFAGLFGAAGGDWAREASIRLHVDAPVPPALVMNAAGEPEKFRRQSDLLFETLEPAAPGSSRVVVPGQNHQRILVSLSLEDDPASRAVLAFLEQRRCKGAGS
jgi:acetyl esterase/lipase